MKLITLTDPRPPCSVCSWTFQSGAIYEKISVISALKWGHEIHYCAYCKDRFAEPLDLVVSQCAYLPGPEVFDTALEAARLVYRDTLALWMLSEEEFWEMVRCYECMVENERDRALQQMEEEA